MNTTPHQLELSELKRDWIEDAAVQVLAMAWPEGFSSDDLHGRIQPEPLEWNWWGCLIAKLRNTGRIVRTGSKPSIRPEANGRWIGVYVVKVN